MEKIGNGFDGVKYFEKKMQKCAKNARNVNFFYYLCERSKLCSTFTTIG